MRNLRVNRLFLTTILFVSVSAYSQEKNPALADSLRSVDVMIARDIIQPVAFPGGKPAEKAPNWSGLEKEIARKFGAKTAQRNVLNNKCAYYHQKKEWNLFIPAWINKIDSVGVDMKDIWGGVEVNNTIFEIIFKYSNDPYALAKSIQYMEALLEIDPNSASRLDTYASVLYKSGQKQKAIEIEKKALKIAQDNNDEANAKLFSDIIAKMQKGEPTWID